MTRELLGSETGVFKPDLLRPSFGWLLRKRMEADRFRRCRSWKELWKLQRSATPPDSYVYFSGRMVSGECSFVRFL